MYEFINDVLDEAMLSVYRQIYKPLFKYFKLIKTDVRNNNTQTATIEIYDKSENHHIRCQIVFESTMILVFKFIHSYNNDNFYKGTAEDVERINWNDIGKLPKLILETLGVVDV